MNKKEATMTRLQKLRLVLAMALSNDLKLTKPQKEALDYVGDYVLDLEQDELKKYAVTWSKTYYAHGEQVIEANSRVEAEEIVEKNIGDYEGSMQWNPDESTVEAFELKES